MKWWVICGLVLLVLVVGLLLIGPIAMDAWRAHQAYKNVKQMEELGEAIKQIPKIPLPHL